MEAQLETQKLEKGVFELPKPMDKTPVISWSTLMMIVEGISLDYLRRKSRFQTTKNLV